MIIFAYLQYECIHVNTSRNIMKKIQDSEQQLYCQCI